MAARLGQVLYGFFFLVGCGLVGFWYLMMGKPLGAWQSQEWIIAVIVFGVPWAIGRATYYVLAGGRENLHDTVDLRAGPIPPLQSGGGDPTVAKMKSLMSDLVGQISEETSPKSIYAAAFTLASFAGFIVGFAAARGAGRSLGDLVQDCQEQFLKGAHDGYEGHVRR